MKLRNLFAKLFTKRETCRYCTKPSDGEFCSDECSARYADEMAW